ncbi:MAG: PQQ-binding-like beta-propeller repeat protein [Sphingobium sp.]
MSRRKWLVAGVGLAAASLGLSLLHAAPSGRGGASDWSHFAGDLASTQYSPLSQIDRSNVTRLEPAWHYLTGDQPGVATPLVADGLIFVLTDGDGIAALDIATGREVWKAPQVTVNLIRGFSYWRSADGRQRRLLVVRDQKLHAIDAATGRPIADFGEDGAVDLRAGLGRDVSTIGSIQPLSPGKVVGDIIIMGSNTGEGYGSPPGDIRAYNVVTGKLVWQFHTIPHPGEAGEETWPADAWKSAGGANNWGGMSVDARRGIAYLGLGSATYDFSGGDRKGQNLYGDSLIALDIRTGRLIWHFQFVHHDLWDYDLVGSPVLMRIRRNGKPVDVVAQAGKSGWLFVFDRATGKPIFPIEERPVPASDMEGEEAWPTQPFPALPPFSLQHFSVDDLDPSLPEEERRAFAAMIAELRNEGPFTPPSQRGTLQMPGNHGGTNWGLAAGDPEKGRYYVASFNIPTVAKLVKMDAQPASFLETPRERGRALYANNCALCHGANMEGQPPVPGLRDVVARQGKDRVRQTVSSGRATMPAFAGSLSAADLDALTFYLADPDPVPAVGNAGAKAEAASEAAGEQGHGASGADLNAQAGKGRWYSGYGYMLSAKTFLPVSKPPWSMLTAYDLNEGRILWQAPLGSVPSHPGGLTGVPLSKGGVLATKGGLVFATTSADRKVHAYDSDTGVLLWERELPSVPQGVPAIYATGGRQFLIVPTAFYYPDGASPYGPQKGPKGANGYYAFALPDALARRMK